MPRHILALDLADDPDSIRRYCDWHRPGKSPFAVTRSLKEAGILELEIFLTGNRLVMIIEANSEFSPSAKADADAADADVQAWEELMGQFQRALPWAGPGQKWVPMDRIYALSEQPDPIR